MLKQDTLNNKPLVLGTVLLAFCLGVASLRAHASAYLGARYGYPVVRAGIQEIRRPVWPARNRLHARTVSLGSLGLLGFSKGLSRELSKELNAARSEPGNTGHSLILSVATSKPASAGPALGLSLASLVKDGLVVHF